MDQSYCDSFIYRCIRYPVTVSVGVAFVFFFGFQSIFQVPIQLTPDVSRPTINIETLWPGANPQEIEREVVEKQEEQLQSLEGLLSMESQISPNLGQITLEFDQGTNIDAAVLKVNNNLNRVPNYPPEVKRPVITSGGGARQDAIGWFMVQPLDPQSTVRIPELLQFVRDEVETRFERVKGVAGANVFGGQEREILISFRPGELARRGLSMIEVGRKIQGAHSDISAGKIEEGKRAYAVRTLGAMTKVADFTAIVIRDQPGDRILLGDIATISENFQAPNFVIRYKGVPAIGVNAQKQVGSNVLEVMGGLREQVDLINCEIFAPRGLQLIIAHDTTRYIHGALNTVRDNIIMGTLLATFVLFLFLRAWVPTLIIAISIPISMVGTFTCLLLLGRNVNLVSLAGLSFASGMLVDNSIVVLENIYTWMQKGHSPEESAVRGTDEVWLAVLASTLTTMAVFLPVFFIQAEVAQLFKDICIAIACSVFLSLIVAVTVIPTLAAHWTGQLKAEGEGATRKGRPMVGRMVRWLGESALRRYGSIFTLVFASLAGSWVLMPPAEYLPEGNLDMAFGILVPPPGYSVPEIQRVARIVEKEVSPLWEGENPQVRNFFFGGGSGRVFMGIRPTEGTDTKKLIPIVQAALGKVPGMIAIVVQAGLFEGGLSGGRGIDLKIQGPDLEVLFSLAQRIFFGILQNLPKTQARPNPGLEMGQPELRFYPNRVKLDDIGLSVGDLGRIIDILSDGAKIGEMTMGDGKVADITLRGDPREFTHTQNLGDAPLFFDQSGILPLSSIAQPKLEMGPTQILRSERRRTVSISISPPPDMPLELAITQLREKVLAPIEKEGRFKPPYGFRLAGTADKLTHTRKALAGNFLTAVGITYLLLVSLYESWIYPLVVMCSVPLSFVGGLLMLKGINLAGMVLANSGFAFLASRPSLDVLSMLGFIILVGTVINNAILIVDRGLTNIRERGMDPVDSMEEAVNNRTRPILMTTATSLFGMGPMVVISGPGSELYRGIGSVVIGGLSIGTVFTLILIPTLFITFVKWIQWWRPGVPV